MACSGCGHGMTLSSVICQIPLSVISVSTRAPARQLFHCLARRSVRILDATNQRTAGSVPLTQFCAFYLKHSKVLTASLDVVEEGEGEEDDDGDEGEEGGGEDELDDALLRVA